ncbi:MAG: hypothetical protein A3C93_02840 [Candidatus Lloydbacteria bacterium RIFCSPHIGHO2_02_FULL_54_17]|uniref:Uncharacterized protein n=1 Tax=Candidatus Lloydbacteria bacterium RIFCSPHIGHO2_02_FULL_54_17 TaxID=1798664 RepID=A0A1G2DCT8_9BACT|nr:MAG: hypothetical protein A2762_04710 [Candidatus Lloydbacteria bacterium RIFCSPHIGHO2_01_FULL_54_11]OGZ10608.1 MAG: hypothetical protein A3C93_02840 [Candidatus Lloydbacteria bacterium RIFCSPHIGHO2_02_FULL_54_17]OGZ13643.1 MAG: hypothetical protein A2948_03030 [Candidatus Lloydbacteria bacterium RIFCSPLOWO2_01_FULL_54_18]
MVLLAWAVVSRDQAWVTVPSSTGESFDYDQDLDKLPLAQAVIKLERISERPGGRPDLGLYEERVFDFYIERPDVGLKQEDFVDPEGSVYTSDLPPALRTMMLYTSDTDDNARDGFGSSCHFGGFPHTCTRNLYNDKAGKPETIFVKMVFADNTYAAQEITIPYGGMLDEPTVAEPKVAPKNGDRFSMKFRDVGADHYRVAVSICHPYANNGINPCLNENNFGYDLVKKDGKFVLDDFYASDAHAPDITITGNSIELKSDTAFVITGSDNSVSYAVFAEKEGLTDDYIKTHLESRSETELTLVK